MSNRRLIAMIGGRAPAAESVQLSSLAAQPQIVRALSRATLAVGAAGLVCALTAGLGGGLLTVAANAAVAGGGGYGSEPTQVGREPLAGLRGVAASEPVVEQAVAPPVALKGIVAPSASAAVPAVIAPDTVEAIITEVFGTSAGAAIGVARCESTLRPGAISPNGANFGLFQINAVHRGRVARMGYRWEDLLDARVNALVAKSIFDEQGWGPWACRWAAD